MDVVRAPRRRISPLAAASAGVAALVLVAGASLQWLYHAHGTPTLDRATLLTDVVRRGQLTRTVDAPGTFQPGRIRIVAATQTGVLDRILIKPGSFVVAGAPVASMLNPDLVATTSIAASQVDVARADLTSAREQARSLELGQQSLLEDARAQHAQDRVQFDAYEKLHSTGYVAENEYRAAQIAAAKSARQVAIGSDQVQVSVAEAAAKIAQAQALLDSASATLAADRAQVDALTVHSAVAGIVQSVALDPGARVEIGAEIARVADPRDLKIVLAVGESDIASVRIGMQATATTGSHVYAGTVSRIAPTAQNGTVAVDVTLATPPPGARADTTVEGSLVVEQLGDVLSIARPAGVSDDSTVNLFRVVDGSAVRVRVTLGGGSFDRITVRSGLNAGDTVIISDMSANADVPEVRLQ